MRLVRIGLTSALLAAICGCGRSPESPRAPLPTGKPSQPTGKTESAPPSTSKTKPEDAALPRIKIDWDRPQQTIVGFGGSMGWIHPHAKHRQKIFDLLFKELGASVLRIRALGGETGDEDSCEPVNDNDDPSIFNWAAYRFKTTEARNAVIIKGAQKRGVKVIIPTAWSPPGWMKSSGQRGGGWGDLKEEMLDEYAEVWAAYFKAMKRDHGITLKHLSIQNEPDLTYYYPTCGMSEKLYGKAMAKVRKRLQDEKLKVRVLGPDVCRIYNVKDYVGELEKQKVNPGEPILTHLYDLAIPYEEVDKDPERWQELRKYAGKVKRPIWLMETGNYLSNTKPASYTEAMIWAQKIHHALVEGSCQVVCYWSLYFDKPGEALIYAKASDAEEFQITPKYYTSMHWYKFVRPGMVRCKAQSPLPKILATAFRKGSDRVVVLVNLSDEAIDFKNPGGRASEVWQTTPAKNCKRIAQPGASLSLAPQSVTTVRFLAQQG